MATKSKKTLLPKVQSLAQLRSLADSNSKYEQLMMISASNLGKHCANKEEAYNWLLTNCSEGGTEEGVVDEVNFCRDLVT